MAISNKDKRDFVKREFEYQRKSLERRVREDKVSKDFANFATEVWQAIYDDYRRKADYDEAD